MLKRREKINEIQKEKILHLLCILMHFPVSSLDLRLQLTFKVLVILDIACFLVVVSVDFVSNGAAFVIRKRPTLKVLVIVLHVYVSFRV